ILTNMVQIMRSKGASEQSIQTALKGIDEFAKFAIKPDETPTSGHPAQPQPTLTSDEAPGLLLSDVEMQEVHWLWEKRITLGKLTILDGDPGMGKSLLAIALAASVSTGHPMPDGTPVTQGGVILIAPEDDASDTLKPRLAAANGNPSHVLLLNTVESLDEKKRRVIDRPFSLSTDLAVLEAAMKRTNARLVVLDPLMAVLGHSIDSSRDQDIRAVFTPLSQLAERTNCAILIIRHLSKGTSESRPPVILRCAQNLRATRDSSLRSE
ncbi:MAG: AAA family ATPase, partial [Ktedonobacteraceae bacterium]